MAMAKREPRRPRDPPFCAAPRRRQALPRAEPAATPAAQLSPLKLRLATAQTVAPTSRCKPTQTVGPPTAANSDLSQEISLPQEARRPRAVTSRMLSVAAELGQQGKALACNEARAEGPIGQNRLCRTEEEAAFVKPLNRPNSGKIRMKKSGLGKEDQKRYIGFCSNTGGLAVGTAEALGNSGLRLEVQSSWRRSTRPRRSEGSLRGAKV